MSRPKNDRAIDLGSPLLNDIADAFLKSATIGVTKAAAEDTYYAVKRGSVSSQDFEYTLKNMCKEGAYYGTVAGVFVTTEYGLESVRGRRDWFLLYSLKLLCSSNTSIGHNAHISSYMLILNL
ncbi:outer envelope pore protein 16, chloroplastic isoform X2 [Rosa chinensis]|uniref:outer envelope pore protein 16, chloroplastic isoform X2 n=1 Tax=Rosa chinensis TaxID=74649 RepID=UPI000D089775|nr:outer envelope pore protein 16, chloroplastic isoform X2 [Rosa chinensis]